jgi:hypothetical protein
MMTMAQCIFTLLCTIISTSSFINSNCNKPAESLTVLGEKEADATMESTNEIENSNQSQDPTDCDGDDKESPQFSLPTPTTSVSSGDEDESEEEIENDNDNNRRSTQANTVVTDLLEQFDEARRDPMLEQMQITGTSATAFITNVGGYSGSSIITIDSLTMTASTMQCPFLLASFESYTLWVHV